MAGLLGVGGGGRADRGRTGADVCGPAVGPGRWIVRLRLRELVLWVVASPLLMIAVGAHIVAWLRARKAVRIDRATAGEAATDD